MTSREKIICGVSLKNIAKFLVVYTLFGLGAYVTKFYIDSEFYKVIFSSILSIILVIYAVPNEKLKELFNKDLEKE
ncbi:TPA: hypothetical protein OZI11_002474 [Staphylococcus aureus]|nr:hypothetical protein [Staphylococcus aureus]